MDQMQSDALGDTLQRAAGTEVHDPDFEEFRNVDVRAPVVLDVGANTGQSIASFIAALRSPRIFSFELNPYMHPVLAALESQLKGVTFYPYGLGDEANKYCRFLVPVTNGEPRLQEASMDPDAFKKPWVIERLRNADPNYTFTEHVGEIRVGDSLRLPKPDILKTAVGIGESGFRGLLRRVVSSAGAWRRSA